MSEYRIRIGKLLAYMYDVSSMDKYPDEFFMKMICAVDSSIWNEDEILNDPDIDTEQAWCFCYHHAHEIYLKMIMRKGGRKTFKRGETRRPTLDYLKESYERANKHLIKLLYPYYGG